ncbi:MAG: hypothetical protein WB998_09640, partial [Solirubrobacteraceae bacterium]
QGPTPVNVAIESQAPGRPIPKRFLGLSFEAAALTELAEDSHKGDLVTLLRSLGPGVLRFGGITADENVAWTDPQTPAPAWASSTIGPAQMKALGELAKRSGWQVLLTVGLAHFEPRAAAREVAAAHHALGPSLAAVEIGNEPNAYGSHGFRGLPWIAQGYEEEVSDYRDAIEALTPGIQIAGPDVSGSGVFAEWGGEEALAQTPALLTGHHYPLGCAQNPPPSIEALLSIATRGAAARSLATYMAVASESGIPFRMDELGSVSCGGVPGVSNTFASALWATGYLAQAMDDGLAGINLQGNPTNCLGYTPVCAPSAEASAEGNLRAQPDWYALLMARSLIGYRPLPTTIGSAAPEPMDPEEPSSGELEAPPPSVPSGTPDLVAASFLGPGHTIKVVLSDQEAQGANPLEIHLTVGAGFAPGDLARLEATSPSATSGVRLGGGAVAANGSWHEPKHPELVTVHGGVATLQLDPSSAALVTFAPPKAKRKRKPAHHGHAKRR